MSSPDKLLARIHALQEGVEEAYRQRLSVSETKRAPNSPANLAYPVYCQSRRWVNPLAAVERSVRRSGRIRRQPQGRVECRRRVEKPIEQSQHQLTSLASNRIGKQRTLAPASSPKPVGCRCRRGRCAGSTLSLRQHDGAPRADLARNSRDLCPPSGCRCRRWRKPMGTRHTAPCCC